MLNILGVLFVIIPGGILGIILFMLLNKYFNVYYFGITGMLATVGGCLLTGIAIVGLTLEIGGSLLSLISQWGAVILITRWIVRKISGKKK